MKALFTRGDFVLDIRELPVPEPSPDEMLVRVRACGLCGTDLHLAKNRQADWMPLGHEIAGEIAALGANVRDVRDFCVGDKVVVEDIALCGVCEACKNGRPSGCRMGPTLNGQPGMSEYLAVSPRLLNPFDGMDFVTASLTEPLAVSINCVQNARIPLGGSVAVCGPGPIGLLCVRLARLYGAARVVLVGSANRTERTAARLAAGRQLGADRVITAAGADAVSEVLREIPGGADSVIVTSPPATLPDALKMVKYGGTVSLAGIDLGGKDKVEISVNQLVFGKITIVANLAEPALLFPTAIRLLSQGMVDAGSIISHRFSFAEAPDLIRRSCSGEEPIVKAVLLP